MSKRTSPDAEAYGSLSEKDHRAEIPKGQRKFDYWPVLSIETPPEFDGKNWDLAFEGLIEKPLTLSWSDFLSLPNVQQVNDLHCVTTWSLLGKSFTGVAFQTILDLVKPLPEAKYVTFEAISGYTAALPLQKGYLLEKDVLLAYMFEGKELESSHGGPVRLLVPQLYLWKSVKWLTKMTFAEKWERGYWEKRGFHQRADPWLEERYSSQEKV